MTTVGSPTDRDKAVINHVFKRLSVIYPAWKQAFSSEQQIREAKIVWFETLVDQGMTTPEAIQRGLKAAALDKSPFLPSIGQFIEWCRDDNVNRAYLTFDDQESLDGIRDKEIAARNGFDSIEQYNKHLFEQQMSKFK